MTIWQGQVLWRVWGRGQGIYVHPHTQLKKSGILHIHVRTQSMRGFSIKTGTDWNNTHGSRFICHS